MYGNADYASAYEGSQLSMRERSYWMSPNISEGAFFQRDLLSWTISAGRAIVDQFLTHAKKKSHLRYIQAKNSKRSQ